MPTENDLPACEYRDAEGKLCGLPSAWRKVSPDERDWFTPPRYLCDEHFPASIGRRLEEPGPADVPAGGEQEGGQ